MTNKELIRSAEILLIQGQNNYYMSDTDIKNAEYALTVLNNIMHTVKILQDNGRNEK